MARSYSSWDRFYQKLNMLFNGIVASSMIIFAILFLQIQRDEPAPLLDDAYATFASFVFIALSLLVLVLASRFHPYLLKPVLQESNIEQKLNCYLGQKLKLYVILEVAGFVAIIGYFVLKSELMALLYLGVLFAFSVYRPTFARVCKEIDVSEKEMIDWSKDNAR